MSTSRVYTVGQVLTAAQMNDLPQGLLNVITGVVSVGPTSGTTTMDIITAGAVTIAGTTRKLRISFTCHFISGTVGTDQFMLRIQEGATILAEYLYSQASPQGVAFFAIVQNPTAGSHTYKATITRTLGTGTATVDAVAGGNIVLTVEDIGQ